MIPRHINSITDNLLGTTDLRNYQQFEMQRSQVKQFKISKSTLFNSTLLGTHSNLAFRSTSPRNQAQLMTSRIAHLPADTHPDLTEEPKMLLVFQAIEIERLTWQADILRGKLKEKVDTVINAGSYEVQIRELMEKCNQLQNQKYSYREELAQTKDMSEMVFNELATLKGRYEDVDLSAAEKYKLQKARNQQLTMEIEKWRSRYAALDRGKSQEFESFRKTIDFQRQSQMNSGVNELLSRFEIQRQELLVKLRQKRQELNQKDLELKKMGNYYEQAQIRLQQQDHSIDQFEEKVALLSQQTYRLSELVRAKSQEIKSLKANNQHDLTLRLEQLTSLDETQNKLTGKLRQVQDHNQELRMALTMAENQTMDLKRKVSETERLEFQVKQAKTQIQTKLKALERKDRRIFLLEQEVKRMKHLQQDLASYKQKNKDFAAKIQSLQVKIQEKINQLRSVTSKHARLEQKHHSQMNLVAEKMKEYQRLYETLEISYNQLLSSDMEFKEKSNSLQLQARQTALALKQKDYTISSLQNQLKQISLRFKNSQDQYRTSFAQIEKKIVLERTNFENKIRDAEKTKKDIQLMSRQNQSRNRQSEVRVRELEYKLGSMQTHCRELEQQQFRKQQEILELKSTINNLIAFQDDITHRQTQISVQLRGFQVRLARIEQIIQSLRTKLLERYQQAQQSQERLRFAQTNIEDLQQWFFKIAQRLQEPLQSSPYPSPKKRDSANLSPMRTRPFYSPEPVPTYQHNYAQSSSIYGFKDRQTQNTNLSNTSIKDLPTEWMIKFVLLCVEVESLRKKVGDKQAKVQSMRSSIASRQGSSATLINGLNGSQSSSTSGFFTSRQKSLNRKNVYC